jgi:hypothetical protein
VSLKGKIENALKQFHFDSLDIFQPSLLNGDRNETRILENIVQGLMDIVSFLFLGPLKKFHPIGADNVAKSMVYAAKQNKKGIHYYTYHEMMEMARDYNDSNE